MHLQLLQFFVSLDSFFGWNFLIQDIIMLQSLFLLFLRQFSVDDPLMPPLELPNLLVPLLPLPHDPVTDTLPRVLPLLSLLPVHWPQLLQPTLLGPLRDRARAHLIMSNQLPVTLCCYRVLQHITWVLLVYRHYLKVNVCSIHVHDSYMAYYLLRWSMFRMDFLRECSWLAPGVEGLWLLRSWKVARRSWMSRIS